MNDAELVAVRVQIKELQKLRRDFRTIKTDAKEITGENRRSASSVDNHSRAVRSLTGRYRDLNRAASMNPALAGMARMRTAMGGFNSSISRTIALYGTLAAAGATVYKSIQAIESKKGFERALRFNLGERAAGKVAEDTEAFANKQGLPLQSIRYQQSRLAGTGNVAPDELVATLKAFTALGAAGGANAESIARAFEQYAQVAGQGKLQGDELKLMQEAGVNLRKLIQEAGMGDRIGSQTEPLKFDEINKLLLAFGKRKDVEGLLAEQAAQASASLQRLGNTVQQKVLAPLGEGLTPAINELAGRVEAWVAGIDPEDIRKKTAFLADNAGTIGTGIVLVWGAFKVAKAAEIVATWRASTALTALAASAGKAGVANALGGGLPGKLGKVGGAAGKLGGAAAAGQAGKWVYGAGQGMFVPAAEATGGAAATGGSAAGAAGPLAAAAVIGTEIGLGIVAGIEKLAGVKSEDSFFARIQGFRPEENQKQEQALMTDLKAMRDWRRRKTFWESLQKKPKSGEFHTSDENYENWTGDRKPSKRARSSDTSPRAAAFDNQTAEANARATRASL